MTSGSTMPTSTRVAIGRWQLACWRLSDGARLGCRDVTLVAPTHSLLSRRPPAASSKPQSKAPARRRQRAQDVRPGVAARRPVLASRFAVCTGLAAILYFTNLTESPDFDIDETFYASAGQHIGCTAQCPGTPIRYWFIRRCTSWRRRLVVDHRPSSQQHLLGHPRGSLPRRALDVLIVALVGLCARAWSEGQSAAARGRLLVLSMLLTALNGFLLRFGRAVLIEPMAVCVGLATLLVSWHLRRTRSPIYVAVVGLFIGFSVLTEPAIFIAGAPLVTAILSRNRTAVIRNAGALVVGGAVWSSFPLWAAVNGTWSSFYFQQTVSIRRLLGLLQLSGLTEKACPRVRPLPTPSSSMSAAISSSGWAA